MMAVGILLITHGNIGWTTYQAAQQILPYAPPLATKLIDIWPDHKTESLSLIEARIHQTVDELDSGNGVLILCDLMGSTPWNIPHRVATQLVGNHDLEIIAGLNLSMLLRVYNYADKNLQTLSRLALEGGIRGLVQAGDIHASKKESQNYQSLRITCPSSSQTHVFG